MMDRRSFWLVVFAVAAALGALAVYIGNGLEWYQLYDAVRDFVTRSAQVRTD